MHGVYATIQKKQHARDARGGRASLHARAPSRIPSLLGAALDAVAGRRGEEAVHKREGRRLLLHNMIPLPRCPRELLTTYQLVQRYDRSMQDMLKGSRGGRSFSPDSVMKIGEADGKDVAAVSLLELHTEWRTLSSTPPNVPESAHTAI